MARIQPMGKFRSFIKRIPQSSVSNSTGRYFPGQTLYGIAFSYPSKAMSSCSPPLLFDNEMPSKIHIVELTVTEHHRVPDHWDNENKLTCDGYILQNKEGKIYHNQYPRASYGQLSDSADRCFAVHVENQEEAKKAIDESKENPYQYQLITDIYERITNGIRDIKELINKEKDYFERGRFTNKVNNLEEIRVQIETELEKKFNKYIKAKKHPRFNFFECKVFGTKEEALAFEYTKVKLELIELAQRCKKFKVNHKKRIKPGLYARMYDDNYGVGVHVTIYEIKGYSKKKKSKYSSKNIVTYETCHFSGGKKSKTSYDFYGSDFASSATAYKLNSKVKLLIEAMKKASTYDFVVAVEGTKDTVDNFVIHKQEIEFNKYFDSMAENEPV